MTLPAFILTDEEFRAALYWQNTQRDDAVLIFNQNRPHDDPRAYECANDGTSKPLGLYVYHFVGCKVDGSAIILHGVVVHTLL